VTSGCKPLTARALFLPTDGGVVGGLGCRISLASSFHMPNGVCFCAWTFCWGPYGTIAICFPHSKGVWQCQLVDFLNLWSLCLPELMCNSWCLPWRISVEHSCMVLDCIQVHVYRCGYFLQDEFMSFIVMLMGSALPYLRAKMVEILNAWMPSKRWYSHPSFWGVLLGVHCD